MLLLAESFQPADLSRTPANAKNAPAEQPTAFVTPRMQVYIEDTDAYGVMYNANYLRAYERALHLMSLKQDDTDDDPLPLLNGGALSHAGWFVLGVTDHRFKASPPLGGEYVISGELVERECENEGSSRTGACVETWKVEMKSPFSAEPNEKPTVYNTATITIASPTETGMLPPQYQPKSLPFVSTDSGGPTVRARFQPFRDEFDPTLPHRMPLRNVLNLFERARSDFLGGPDELRKMEAEDNVVWVVTSVAGCELCNLGEAGWEENDNEDLMGKEEGNELSLVQCSPGKSVTVKTSFVSKRSGMTLECNQMLLVPAWDDELSAYKNRRLAQGKISIMALDAKKRRPTRNIPQRFIDKLNSAEDN